MLAASEKPLKQAVVMEEEVELLDSARSSFDERLSGGEGESF